MTVSALQGTFTTVGQFSEMTAERGVNISLRFGNGIIIYERSFDNRQTWFTIRSFADSDTNFFDEPEVKVWHRLRVAAIAAPIAFRISN